MGLAARRFASSCLRALAFFVGQRVVLTVQVMREPLLPRVAEGAGFVVTALDATGHTTRIATNAHGSARIEVESATAPWDIAVTRTGYSTVSVVGIVQPGTFDIGVRPVDLHMVDLATFSGSLSGRIVGTAPGHTIQALAELISYPSLRPGHTITPGDYAISVLEWPGGPRFRPLFIDLDAERHFAGMLRAPPMPRPVGAVHLDLTAVGRSWSGRVPPTWKRFRSGDIPSAARVTRTPTHSATSWSRATCSMPRPFASTSRPRAAWGLERCYMCLSHQLRTASRYRR